MNDVEPVGRLNKLLWMHVAELKLAEARRRDRRRTALKVVGVAAAIVVALTAALLLVFR